MDEVLTHLTPDELGAMTLRVLEGARALASAATDFNDLFPRIGGSVNLAIEARTPLGVLAKIGVSKIDDLFADVPHQKLMRDLPNLPRTKSELDVEREMGRLAQKSTPAVPVFLKPRLRKDFSHPGHQ